MDVKSSRRIPASLDDDDDGASSVAAAKKPRIKEDDVDDRTGDLPSDKEEETLFRLWMKASTKAAEAATLPSSSSSSTSATKVIYKAARALHDEYLDECDRILKGKDLVYDPTQRRFVDAFRRLDSYSSRLFFQYYPISSNTSKLPQLQGKEFKHRYELRLLSPEARRFRSTQEHLQRYLIRRYRQVYPKRVAIFISQEEKKGEEQEEVGVTGPDGVVWKVFRIADHGEAFNQSFHQIMRRVNSANKEQQQDCYDLVIIWQGRHKQLDMKGGQVDLFMPAYPVLLREGQGMMLTPIQIYQLDGCLPTSKNIVLDLLNRTRGILGAVLVRGGDTRIPSCTRYNNGGSKINDRGGGLSSLNKEGMEKDPRVYRISHPLASHVPKNRHGWLSMDTKICLVTALRAYVPISILELGSWYGLSSRFILDRALSRAQFYTVDWFKNNALYASRMEDLSPLDKLYLTHLRFETFHANLQDYSLSSSSAAAGGGDSAAAAAAATEEGGERQEQRRVEDSLPVSGEEEKQGGGGRVFMIRMDIHEAIHVCKKHQVEVEMVFIDAEKKTHRLLELIRNIMQMYPKAVIVGDDYVFPSVKKAIEELNLPGQVITREESYLILPQEREEKEKMMTKEKVLQVMEELEPELVVPTYQREVLALIEAGKDKEAVNLAEAHGLGLTDELYSPGKSVIHDICRRRDASALAFVQGVVDSLENIPLNDIGMTPFDYLTHTINFS